MAGAEYLQSIFGTEKDKVNCPFYFKIGACRHGDKCERRHNKPALSQTLIFNHMYQNPVLLPNYDEKQAQLDFEDFYEDIFDELAKYGEIEELHVNDNVCDHMVGNIYVKYFREEDADRALKALTGRFYAGRPVVAEFSPVTDFKEASCRQHENHECNRGGHCNFMHLKAISRDLYKKLFTKRKSKRDRSRSKDRKNSRRKSRSPSPHSRDRHRSSRKHRSRSRSKEHKKGGRGDYREKDRDGKEYIDERERERERDRPDRHYEGQYKQEQMPDSRQQVQN